MTRREWRFVLVLAAAVVMAVAVPWLRPDPVDWTDSFERGDARPYGSRVLFETLPALFPEADTVRAVPTTPYLWLRNRSGDRSAYIFVTNRLQLDPTEVRAVLDYVEQGNVVFAAAQQFGGPLADSLALATALDLEVSAVEGPMADSGSTRLHLSARNLDSASGSPVRGDASRYAFTTVDTARTTILGATPDGDPTLIRTRWGDGHLVLSSTPRVFTNYHTLDRHSRPYVWAALSHVPADRRTVWWDGRHKPGAARAQTVMRFVLSDPALRMAYWLLIGGAVLFVVMRGRRRQRPVPVVEPPRNRTLEFVRHVGQLYYERGTALDLAQKKIDHFQTYLRRLDLPPDPVRSDWTTRVARRTGVPASDVEAVGKWMSAVRGRSSLSPDELKALDERLDTFYERADA